VRCVLCDAAVRKTQAIFAKRHKGKIHKIQHLSPNFAGLVARNTQFGGAWRGLAKRGSKIALHSPLKMASLPFDPFNIKIYIFAHLVRRTRRVKLAVNPLR
jgi:hypothetical protein